MNMNSINLIELKNTINSFSHAIRESVSFVEFYKIILCLFLLLTNK
jgi:hypothetical protein